MILYSHLEPKNLSAHTKFPGFNRKYKAHRIRVQIQELQDELRKHQDRCKHAKVEKTAGSNAGNWDPSDDWYWYDCFCPVCLKRWTEEQ
jgi:hypothetical protein